MRSLRAALLALAVLLPVLAVTCCVPGPVDACCNEEAACPIAGAGECILSHATPTATVALERDPGSVVLVLPAFVTVASTLDPVTHRPDPRPPRAASLSAGFSVPRRI